MLSSARYLLAFVAAAHAGQSPPPAGLLARVAEEAEVLLQNAPRSLTRETLEQRATLPPSRFRPRIGSAASQTPAPRLQVREVVSEYSVGALHQSESQDLVEFRQVVAVDGRTIQTPEKARHALSLGLRSADDRARKRMLEDFAKHGLVDVATDYGLILLAFTARGMTNMQIAPGAEAALGTDTALRFSWRQNSPESGELQFSGRTAMRLPLAGTLWVRKSDGLPLRIETWAEHADGGRTLRDEATVEYRMSTHGFLTPATVRHRHLVNGQLTTENFYRYEPFKLFTANTEIKFTEVPEQPAAKR